MFYEIKHTNSKLILLRSFLILLISVHHYPYYQYLPIMQLKPPFSKRRTTYSLNSKTVRNAKDTLQDLDLSNFSKGFNKFSQTSTPYLTTTTKQLGFFRMSESQDVSKSDINMMLSENKNKYGIINKKVAEKRKYEYETYMNSNVKYCKLLELNNIRSRVMTSLKSNVGEIFIKLIDEHKPEDYEYVAEFHKAYITGWKPESREGQTCTVYKDSLYLIGGHNSNPLGEVCVYNFKEGVWSQIADTDVKRSYHTTAAYRDHYFIVFGGMSHYNVHFKARECLNTTLLFSPLVAGTKSIKIMNEHLIQPRRSHSACVVGKQMLVFGGINMFKSYLKDLIYLDFRELKWVEVDYKIETPQLEEFLTQGIAKHAMIQNFKNRQGHCKLYKRDYGPEEGVFVFGGVNQAGMRSVLIHITFRTRIPKLHKLYPSGYLPSAVSPMISRVNFNVIAVVSGQRAEREMKLYKIKQNQFVSVHYNTRLAELGGIGSSLVNYQDQMHVLFGVGEKGYIGTISHFKLEQKLKSQIEKEGGKKLKRQSFVVKQSKMWPSYTTIQKIG